MTSTAPRPTSPPTSPSSINVAYFSNQFASAAGHGIAHYAHRLYEGLSTHLDLNIIPIATGTDRSPAAHKALTEQTGLKLLPGGRKLTPLAWLLLNAPAIETLLPHSVDITHIVSLGFPVATHKKLVVTVHDIGPLTHPEYFTNSKPRLFKRSFDHMIRYADAIICVSQVTADAVVGYAGEAMGEAVGDRITVIHEGVDAAFFSQAPVVDPYPLLSDLPSPHTPFFMAAGAMSPRKNIGRVLEAFRKVKDTIPHHLVLVGGTGWDSTEILRLLEDEQLASRVHQLGYVSDEQLQALYKHADFYIHASLFEGFGLTVLEAMAAGCPVITSNISSLPEVAGDAALLISPTSPVEIANAIESFALTPSLRTHYTERGLKHVQSFSWASTAQGVANIYRGVGR